MARTHDDEDFGICDLDPKVKDARVEVLLKNNILLKAIEAKFGNVSRMCKALPKLGKPHHIYNLINLRFSPYLIDGTFTEPVERLAIALEQQPTVLFPEQLYCGVTDYWRPRKKVIEMNFSEVEKYLANYDAKQRVIEAYDTEHALEDVLLITELDKVLKKIPAREESVFRMRNGLSPHSKSHSFEEIAQFLETSSECARQRYHRALIKLRGPEISESLLEFYK